VSIWNKTPVFLSLSLYSKIGQSLIMGMETVPITSEIYFILTWLITSDFIAFIHCDKFRF